MENHEQIALISKNAKILDSIAHSGDYFAMLAVAKNIYTSSDTLHYLISIGYFAIDCEVIKNVNVSDATLKMLANKDITKYSSLIVQSNNTSTSTLNYIFDNISLCTNKKTIKLYIANHINASQRILQEISKSEDIAYLIAVINNPSTSEFTINELVFVAIDNDNCIDMLCPLARHINTKQCLLSQLAEIPIYSIQKEIAMNTNTPGYTLEMLGNLDNVMIQKYVALNPNTNKDTLTYLSTSDSIDILENVASNSNTSNEIFLKLIDLFHFNVTYNIIKNKNASKTTLEYISNKENQISLLNRVAKDKLKEK